MDQAVTSKKVAPSACSASGGFTLYELLIGGAIGAIVVAGAIASFDFFLTISNKQKSIASESRHVYAMQAFVRRAKENLVFIPPSSIGGLCVVDLRPESLSFIRKESGVYVRETFVLLGGAQSYFGKTVQVFTSGAWSTISQDYFGQGVVKIQFFAEVLGCPPTGISMTVDLIDTKNFSIPRIRSYNVDI